MLVIKNLYFYPVRFLDERRKKNWASKVESLYRYSIDFARLIKFYVNSFNVNLSKELYELALIIDKTNSSIKNKKNIGPVTIQFVNDISLSLAYCGNDAAKFCSYVRTNIYKNDLVTSIGEELYSYLKSISFVFQYHNDYDRIVSSSSFRRLQDKAQVFSLESFDYVRTRLTHSNEVSAISEQLVTKVMYEAVLTRENLNQYISLGIVARCASLLHDIGNPPFGHYGEHIIRQYFSMLFSPASTLSISNAVTNRLSLSERQINKIIVNKQYINDFLYFDGNAQAFRIVNHLQQYRDKSSLNLTASVLRSIIKYPCNSINTLEVGKFGYFHSEEDIIEFLKSNADYQDKKIYYPALIMEVADDIAYNISDFEDSFKKGLITYEDLVNVDISRESKEVKQFISNYIKYYNKNKKCFDNPSEVTLKSLVQSLKISLISEAAYVLSIPSRIPFFLDRSVKNNHVLDYVPSYSICKFIKKQLIKEKVYTSKMISESELEADTIMTYLLDEFVKAILYIDFECKDMSIYSSDTNLNIDKYKKIINLISPHLKKYYVNTIKNINNPEEKLYYRLKIAVDYVSGMTDSYAKHVYQMLLGK